MSKAKRRVPISRIIAALILCLILAGAVYAAIMRSTKTDNIITFGSIKMRLIETTIKDGVETDVADGFDENITSSTSVSRNVRVQNIHNHPIYVRLKLDMTFHKDGQDDSADHLVNYDYNETDFTYQDGYWYYNSVLAPDEVTPNLITTISFNLGLTPNQFKGGTFNLKIDAQAVQSEHNAETALESVGWPQN